MKRAADLMNDELRVLIAEDQGWVNFIGRTDAESEFYPELFRTGDLIARNVAIHSNGLHHHVPNYPADLNAIREVVLSLNYKLRNRYLNVLCDLTREEDMDDVDADFAWCDASARQRAEAYAITKGLALP